MRGHLAIGNDVPEENNAIAVNTELAPEILALADRRVNLAPRNKAQFRTAKCRIFEGKEMGKGGFPTTYAEQSRMRLNTLPKLNRKPSFAAQNNKKRF